MKVVTPAEMKRLEELAFQEGSSAEDFMESAGKAVADEAFKRGTSFTIICGKGNNAGDGLVAARYLAEKGLDVEVILLFEEGSPLYQKQLARYKALKKPYMLITSAENIVFKPVVITALFGTGFQGALSGLPLAVTEKLNQTKSFVIAVDIPSGVNGETGEVLSQAVKAHVTVTLGLPKTGLFLQKGYEYAGEIRTVSFGLPEQVLQMANASYELFDSQETPLTLPRPGRTWHKYQRGYVIGLAGSPGMMGAASLATESALRSGSGIVRLLMHKTNAHALSFLKREVLAAFFEEDLSAEMARASALFVGPGMGRKDSSDLLTVINMWQKPLVIDADALWWLAEKTFKAPRGSVLTPHRGEMARLSNDPEAFVNENDVILILKGAPTFIYAKDKLPLIMTGAPAAMATAGSGDVLTGIVASFMAQKLSPYLAAKTAVFVHSLAGKLAFDAKGFGAVAGDFVEALPAVIKKITIS